MSNLYVTDITVPVLLDRLRKREWQVPQFQREFVWSAADVIELIKSILESRPIGMATLWEQGPSPEVPVEPVWITDVGGRRYLEGSHENPNKVFAILDGRQRCTAIAMAFGGLRAQDGKFKFSGRFYLDLATTDPTERVVYLKEAEVRKRGLNSDSTCIGQGLFPLSSTLESEELLGQWMRYLQALNSASNYPENKLPAEVELLRRDQILKSAFQGLVGTKLAVYVVPETYHLSEICEIFETLNTTGTKVSTVDLIHSRLYADTRDDPEGPILVREWIADLGQKDGAIGWSSVEDRPELVAQMVTACYVAANSKPSPSRVAGSDVVSINSVKAGDLLATPTIHWRSIIQNDDLLANFIGDFQKVVANGFFPYIASPYPVSAAIYVGLRWHLHFDQPDKWGRDDLNSAYRAFFWRNALTSRYDQGFLTQLGKDIDHLKRILSKRQSFQSGNEWAIFAQREMQDFMGGVLPSKEQLVDLVSDGRQTGALQKALTLPMIAGVHQDLLEPQKKIFFPGGEPVELHHIYPKAWCNNSKAGELVTILDKDMAGKNWVDSTANLMPLSRKSNNIWKSTCELDKSRYRGQCEAGKEVARLACESGKAAEKGVCEVKKQAELQACNLNQTWLSAWSGAEFGAVSGEGSMSPGNVQVGLSSITVPADFSSISVAGSLQADANFSLDFTLQPYGAGYIACQAPWGGTVSFGVQIPARPLNISATVEPVSVPADKSLDLNLTTAPQALTLKTSTPPALALLTQNPDFVIKCIPATAALGVGVSFSQKLRETLIKDEFDFTVPSQHLPLNVKPFVIDIGGAPLGLAPKWGEKSIVFVSQP